MNTDMNMNTKVVEYKIVTGRSSEELEDAVNSWIEHGYEPMGGLVATAEPDGGAPMFYQPVTLARRTQSATLIGGLEKAGFKIAPANGNGSARAQTPTNGSGQAPISQPISPQAPGSKYTIR
jgi:hypothetical protein